MLVVNFRELTHACCLHKVHILEGLLVFKSRISKPATSRGERDVAKLIIKDKKGIMGSIAFWGELAHLPQLRALRARMDAIVNTTRIRGAAARASECATFCTRSANSLWSYATLLSDSTPPRLFLATGNSNTMLLTQPKPLLSHRW